MVRDTSAQRVHLPSIRSLKNVVHIGVTFLTVLFRNDENHRV